MKNIRKNNFLQKLFICLCIFFSGCGVSILDIQPYSKNPTSIKKIETEKRFTLRDVNDKRGMDSTVIGLVKTGLFNTPTPLYSKRNSTELVKNTFEKALEITNVKAESLKVPDYFIDITINELEFHEKTLLMSEYGYADAKMDVTFVLPENNKPLMLAQINETKQTEGFDVSGSAEKLLTNVLETAGEKFITDGVEKVITMSPAETTSFVIKEPQIADSKDKFNSTSMKYMNNENSFGIIANQQKLFRKEYTGYNSGTEIYFLALKEISGFTGAGFGCYQNFGIHFLVTRSIVRPVISLNGGASFGFENCNNELSFVFTFLFKECIGLEIGKENHFFFVEGGINQRISLLSKMLPEDYGYTIGLGFTSRVASR
ncbi:MAG: hypothetical protein WC614_04255 [bacterium]